MVEELRAQELVEESVERVVTDPDLRIIDGVLTGLDIFDSASAQSQHKDARFNGEVISEFKTYLDYSLGHVGLSEFVELKDREMLAEGQIPLNVGSILKTSRVLVPKAGFSISEERVVGEKPEDQWSYKYTIQKVASISPQN